MKKGVRPQVEIYTDGACSCNPGIGGYAAVCPFNGKTLFVAGGVMKATNNGMEIRGAIAGIKALKKPCDVTLYTDSNYFIECIKHDEEWLTRPDRPNRELWIEWISAVKNGGHKIRLVKVKAHSGNKLNEFADKLAKAEIAKLKHKLIGG